MLRFVFSRKAVFQKCAFGIFPLSKIRCSFFRRQIIRLIAISAHPIDFPLPNETAIRRILDDLIAANAGNRRLRINLTETDKDRLVRASLGLTETEAEGALALAMASDGVLDADDVTTVLQEKKQAVRKTGLLEYVDTDIDLTGVGGLDNLKRWLRRQNNS